MTEETKQWYMEYKIHKNRPGLLGDIASMLGILGVNILTINGVEGERRGCFSKQTMTRKYAFSEIR